MSLYALIQLYRKKFNDSPPVIGIPEIIVKKNINLALKTGKKITSPLKEFDEAGIDTTNVVI